MSELPDLLNFLLARLNEELVAADGLDDDPLAQRVSDDTSTVGRLVEIKKAIGYAEPTEQQKRDIEDLMFKIGVMSTRYDGHPDFPEDWRV